MVGGVWRHMQPPFKTPGRAKWELTFSLGWQSYSSPSCWLEYYNHEVSPRFRGCKGHKEGTTAVLMFLSFCCFVAHFLDFQDLDKRLISISVPTSFIHSPCWFSSHVLAESQTWDGETQEGENKPQPGQPENSAAAQAGKGLGLQVWLLIGHTKRLPLRSYSVPLHLTRCLCHRRRRNAGWRRQRSWSTPSSSCRRSGREPPEAAEAGRTPSKTASPAACRGLLGSWAQMVKMCCLGPPSMHLWPRAFPAKIAAVQLRRRATTRIMRQALFLSATHRALCCDSWCASPATGYVYQLSPRPSTSAPKCAVRRQIHGDPAKKTRGSQENGARPAANRPPSFCGDRGREHTQTGLENHCNVQNYVHQLHSGPSLLQLQVKVTKKQIW